VVGNHRHHVAVFACAGVGLSAVDAPRVALRNLS